MTLRYQTFFRAVTLAALLGGGVPAHAAGYTIEGERAAHPNLAHAIDQMRAALVDLQGAPDVFGGHRAAAIADLQRAILSTKRALYYRLNLDDSGLNSVR